MIFLKEQGSQLFKIVAQLLFFFAFYAYFILEKYQIINLSWVRYFASWAYLNLEANHIFSDYQQWRRISNDRLPTSGFENFISASWIICKFISCIKLFSNSDVNCFISEHTDKPANEPANKPANGEQVQHQIRHERATTTSFGNAGFWPDAATAECFFWKLSQS